MRSLFKNRKFCIARRIFRWTRIVIWFAIFLVVVAVAHLHLIGLPDFLKGMLLARLQRAGFEAQFSSVRLGWGPDLTIENASFRRSGQPLAPRLSAAATRLNFDLAALWKRRVQVSSFQVENGKLAFPLSATNDESLSLDHVFLGINFPGTNLLQIAEAAGNFHGLLITLNGTVTNYDAMRAWQPFHLHRAGTNDALQEKRINDTFQEQLRKVAQTVDRIHFGSPPQFHLHATADGSDPNTLRAEMALSAAKADTPWGRARILQVSAAVAHLANSGDQPFARVRIFGADFYTPQGHAAKLDLTTALSRSSESNLEAAINFSATRFHGEARLATTNAWFDADRFKADGRVTLAGTNFIPLAFSGTLQGRQLAAQPGSAQEVRIDLKASSVPPSPLATTNWNLWARLDGYTVDWQGHFIKVDSPKLQMDRFDCTGQWRSPVVALDKVDAQAYGGRLAASASLNVDSRELRVHTHSDIDPHHVVQLLSAPAQRFIVDYTFEKAPEIDGYTRLVLPEWVNRPPDWRKQLLPTVQFAGQFSVGAASYRNVPVTSAQSHFTYTNRVWNLPSIHAATSEGEADIGYTADEVSHEYHFVVDSRVAPKAVASVIPPAAQRWLDQMRFTTPPAIHGELWGAWHARERTGLTAHIALTNFWFRGLKIDNLEAGVDFTNMRVRVSDARLSQAGRELSAALVEADVSTRKISLSNVVSALDLGVVRGVLGPQTPEFLEGIRFDTPPAIKVSGSFNTGDPTATDLHFGLSGEHFHWTNISADTISAAAHWRAREVAVTNLHAGLYSTGALAGWGVFDYQPKVSTDFRGSFAARDINLRTLVRGLSPKRSRVEGMLDGDLTILTGNFMTNTSWQGYGDVHLHDALLWEIPVFGIFSPMLNAMSEGLGESRAHDAGATFNITNGVTTTDNLEIRATGLTLRYQGTFGPNKRINARVEAEVLHKIPGISLMLGVVLTPLSKLFEYKISGTIDDPVAEPLYIPKFLMMILRPFHTLKTLMPNTPAEGQPPPAAKPPPK